MRPSLPSSSRNMLRSLQVTVKLGTQTYRIAVPSIITRLLPTHDTFYEQPQLALATPHSCTQQESATWSDKASELGSALWNGILLATPKSKVSHSRKSMRSANKGLKDRTDFVHCSACGRPKLSHHICATCFFELSRNQKLAQRLGQTNTVVNSQSSDTNAPVAKGHAVPQRSLNPATQAPNSR